LLERLLNEKGNRIPVMSIANDYVVEKFLSKKISFTDIVKLIDETVEKFGDNSTPSAEDLIILNEKIKLYLH